MQIGLRAVFVLFAMHFVTIAEMQIADENWKKCKNRRGEEDWCFGQGRWRWPQLLAAMWEYPFYVGGARGVAISEREQIGQ